MEGMLPAKRIRFRVPKGIKSIVNEVESPITFKNLTDDSVALYWIDFQGKPQLYAELNPVNRTEDGFPLKTFMTHPWVAVYKRKLQALLNGSRYFHPPNPESWKHSCTGWKSSKWNQTVNDDGNGTGIENNPDQFFEVLIEEPGCLSLKELCLLRCCETYSKNELSGIINIPRKLTMEIELCRQKYFWW